MDAVIDELVAQGGRSDEIDLFPLVVFIEEKCGRHTGSEHVVLLAGEAEGELALDIVAAAAAGVVGQIGVALTVTRQALYKLSGSFENIGPDIEGAVHVEHEKLAGKQLGIIGHPFTFVLKI